MSAFVIETSVLENYAAHDSDWDGETMRWKPKGGSRYIVETGNMADVREVQNLVTSESDSLIESTSDIYHVEDSNWESEFVKMQKEYDPDGWDTIYLDPVIRRGKNSHWFMKRGYIAGKHLEDDEKFGHLAGKFVGWVDNLTTGECVLKIEGDKREVL